MRERRCAELPFARAASLPIRMRPVSSSRNHGGEVHAPRQASLRQVMVNPCADQRQRPCPNAAQRPNLPASRSGDEIGVIAILLATPRIDARREDMGIGSGANQACS